MSVCHPEDAAAAELAPRCRSELRRLVSMRLSAATAVTMAFLGRPTLHLMRADDSQLKKALGALSASDQYSVLLQALLTSSGGDRSADVAELVDEMSRQRVPLERETLVSILDATLVQCDGSDALLLRTFDAARRNGACRAFAAFTPAERPAAAPAAPPALPEDERAPGGRRAAAGYGHGGRQAHPPAVSLPALGSGWGSIGTRARQVVRGWRAGWRGSTRAARSPTCAPLQADRPLSGGLRVRPALLRRRRVGELPQLLAEARGGSPAPAGEPARLADRLPVAARARRGRGVRFDRRGSEAAAAAAAAAAVAADASRRPPSSSRRRGGAGEPLRRCAAGRLGARGGRGARPGGRSRRRCCWRAARARRERRGAWSPGRRLASASRWWRRGCRRSWREDAQQSVVRVVDDLVSRSFCPDCNRSCPPAGDHVPGPERSARWAGNPAVNCARTTSCFCPPRPRQVDCHLSTMKRTNTLDGYFTKKPAESTHGRW